MVIVVVGLLSLLPFTPAVARWKRADVGALRIEAACRDGVRVVAAVDGAAGTNVPVGLRLNTNNLTPDTPNTPAASVKPPSAYGPTLIFPEILAVGTNYTPEHPITFPTDQDPYASANYGERTFLFQDLLPAGSQVVLIYRRTVFEPTDVGIEAVAVGNCQLADRETRPLTVADFPGLSPALPAERQTLRLDAPVTNATLLNDTTTLIEGMRFPVSQVTAGKVKLQFGQRPLTVGLTYSATAMELVSARRPNATSAPNLESRAPHIAANGQFVAFISLDSQLVNNDTNGQLDAFVRDLKTGTTELVSRGLNNAPANDMTYEVVVSGDGRYLAFTSFATNLVSDADTNAVSDIFLYDRQTQQTTLVSKATTGGTGNANSDKPSISDDGRFVAFLSNATDLIANDTNNGSDAFVFDRTTGELSLVTLTAAGQPIAGGSDQPQISGNGRFVVFHSSSSSVVPNDTNNNTDVFIHDRQTTQTSRVSVNANGAEANNFSVNASLSSDGRFVAYESDAINLIVGDTGQVISDTKQFTDIFVVDRQTGAVERVSVTSTGDEPDAASNDAAISGDGRFVVFETNAALFGIISNPVFPTVARYDRQTKQTAFVAQTPFGLGSNLNPTNPIDVLIANAEATQPTINADGSLIAFASTARNLSLADTSSDRDVYVRLIGASQTTTLAFSAPVFIPLVRR
jgi:hypothetical protein